MSGVLRLFRTCVRPVFFQLALRKHVRPWHGHTAIWWNSSATVPLSYLFSKSCNIGRWCRAFVDGSITASCFVVIASFGMNAAKTWEFQGLGDTHPFVLLYLLLAWTQPRHTRNRMEIVVVVVVVVVVVIVVVVVYKTWFEKAIESYMSLYVLWGS